MKLVEEGKTKFGWDISLILPELNLKTRFQKSKPITIRSILTHHSRLPWIVERIFSHSKTDSLEKLVSDVIGSMSSPLQVIF